MPIDRDLISAWIMTHADAPNGVPLYAGLVTVKDADAMELRIYRCPACGRLWAITARARSPDPQEQERYIQAKLLGTAHFKGAPRSWVMCFERPLHDDIPEVVAAYKMGGPDAVEAMCPTAAFAQEA